MGTRSLTKFYDAGARKPFATMYRQFDGYPSGHGEELAAFLKERSRVNGLPMAAPVKLANGIGCLAAQAVAHFKKDAGGFYLVANTGGHGEEYAYEVREDDPNKDSGGWRLKVVSTDWKDGRTKKVLFDGDPAKFDPAEAEEED